MPIINNSKDVADIVLGFRQFLIHNRDFIRLYASRRVDTFEKSMHVDPPHPFDQDYHLEDWYQCNWEILVERLLLSPDTTGDFLKVYGEGADYSLSGRIFYQNDSANYALVCRPREKKVSSDPGLIFHSFATVDDGEVLHRPPFDLVLCKTEKGVVTLPLDEIIFELSELTKN